MGGMCHLPPKLAFSEEVPPFLLSQLSSPSGVLIQHLPRGCAVTAVMFQRLTFCV